MAKKSSKDDDKLFGFLGAFLTIIGFVIVYLTKKDSKYAMHYATQGLVLGIAYVIVAIAGVILAFVPVIGWIITYAAWIALVILWFVSWINALSGVEKKLPVLEPLCKKFNF